MYGTSCIRKKATGHLGGGGGGGDVHLPHPSPRSTPKINFVQTLRMYQQLQKGEVFLLSQ